jgi:hypothetical protein
MSADCIVCGEPTAAPSGICSEACRAESVRMDAESEMWADDAAKDRARESAERDRARREDFGKDR